MADETKSNSAAELAPATNNGGKASFSKEYLTTGDRFDFLGRSILNIELKDGQDYTIDEANEIIKKFKEAI